MPARPDPSRARRGRDAGLHPAGHQGQRPRALRRRGRRARLRDGARQHLPPAPGAGRGADRGARRACTASWAGSGRSSPTRAASRSSRSPTAASPTRSRAGAGSRPAGAQVEISEEGVRFRSLLDGSERFLGPEDSMADPGGARLRHRAHLRRVHARPRRPRLHGPLHGAHPPLARPLPRLARAEGPAPPGRLRDRPGRGPRGPAPRVGRGTAAAASTGSRSAAPSGATRRRCTACSASRAAPPRRGAAPPARHRGDRRPAGRNRIGIDLFDCAIPTRLARHGTALAPEPEGRFRIDLAKGRYADDDAPIVEGCPCEACRRHTRAYLHYLARHKDLTGTRLLTLHNLTYMQALVEGARRAIEPATSATTARGPRRCHPWGRSSPDSIAWRRPAASIPARRATWCCRRRPA